MYSEIHINDHMLLRYGYTDDLFTAFQSLVYEGIELPLLMLGAYYYHIRETVDTQLQQPDIVTQQRMNRQVQYMHEYYDRLQHMPETVSDYSLDPGRDAIAFCGQFLDAALKVFPDRKALVLISNGHDQTAVQGKTLPPGFTPFYFQKAYVEEIRQFKFCQPVWLQVHDLVSKHKDHPVFGSEKFGNWLYAQARDAICLINVGERIIREHPVGLFLDHSELIYPGNVLSLLALKYKLPFIQVQSRLLSDVNIIPSRASRYAVYGPHTRNWMTKIGISPDKITTVGSLRFEDISGGDLKTKQDLLNDLGITDARWIVAFTSSPYSVETNEQIMRWFSQAGQELPVLVVIKIHPDDRYPYHEHPDPHIRLMPDGYSLQDLLHASDCAATVVSETALVAAMLEKPLLVLQPSISYHYILHNNSYPKHLAKAHAGAVIHSADDLRQCLTGLMHDDKTRKRLAIQAKRFLRQSLTIKQPKPSQRLYRLVREWMGTKWTEGE
ncbi:hypothetical protein [Paenibacillus tyrfis]|uniref:hypothetical protein n=1 Tax=Paenibacillus tyrfis TaxID=1501230 RepID=UPI00209CB05E|nr:hypothetical protein [Paenibacillus tyrfis]MCP1306856.1 hypothetical protein [Paenibacillus tyrfis]